MTAALKVVVLLEGNRASAARLHEMIAACGAEAIALDPSASAADLATYVTGQAVDVVALDLGSSAGAIIETVKLVRAAVPRVALIVFADVDNEALALRVLQAGAQDLLVTNRLDAKGLLRALRYAVQRQAVMDAMFVEKERAQITLNSIADGVVCADVDGNVTLLNVAAERISGWKWKDAIGLPIAEVARIVDAGSREPITDPLQRAVSGDRTVHLPASSILIRRDGSEVPIEDSVAPIHDSVGNAGGAVIVFRDVSASLAVAQQMAHSAHHDFLTGLPNRMLLDDRIGQAIAFAQRHQNRIAVLFLDLDGFKQINDSLGHAIGDKLLQSVGARLANCVRASDTVSRQGGDEFVVFLSEVQLLGDAAISARRMLRAIADVHPIDTHAIHISASIGVSVYPEDGEDAETLIKNADTAMYQAKQKGQGGYQFFKPAMNARAAERQSIEEALRRALGHQEFTLLYQPKIDLKNGAVAGGEALIRWIHPTRGMLLPSQFIPVAEETGLIAPIGTWVLREVCKQAKAWEAAGMPATTLSVNVSAAEFRDERYLTGLFAVLEETGTDPKCLELELTESALMKRPDAAASMLQTLRARGIKVALDDFGTGYSSLSYLRKFPVDALKIDQSFVRQIRNAGRDMAIVAAVVAMARSLDLRVIAEGVESAEELTFLRDQHCDEAQGYYFSPPVLPHQFARLLKAGATNTGHAQRATMAAAS